MTNAFDPRRYQDDPVRVRERIAADQAACLAGTERGGPDMGPGDWYVFQSFSADGSLTIGVRQGQPDSAAVWPVYEGLSEPVARAAPRGLAAWYRGQQPNGEGPHLL